MPGHCFLLLEETELKMWNSVTSKAEILDLFLLAPSWKTLKLLSPVIISFSKRWVWGAQTFQTHILDGRVWTIKCDLYVESRSCCSQMICECSCANCWQNRCVWLSRDRKARLCGPQDQCLQHLKFLLRAAMDKLSLSIPMSERLQLLMNVR